MASTDRRQFLGGTLGCVAAGGLATQLRAGSAVETQAASQDGEKLDMRFAINIEMWFGRLAFLDRIRAVADLGFDAVEFWPWRNKDLEEVRKTCDETGVEVTQFTGWGFNPGLNDPNNHDAFVKAVEEGCRAAKIIDASMMTIVGGNDQPGMSQAAMHQNIIDGLKRAAPIAAEHEVLMILEPMNIRVDHKGHCLYGSSDAVRICREVDSPWVKINWDLYHMHISEGDLCGHLNEGKDQIGYIQVADHPGRTEPGTGEIHYPRVFKELKKIGYQGAIGVECRPKEGEQKAAARLRRSDYWNP